MLQDLQLLSVGLSEFVHGFTPLGGKRSRGLGACRLEQLQVFSLELVGQDTRTGKKIDAATRKSRLSTYLLGRDIAHKFPAPEMVWPSWIGTLPSFLKGIDCYVEETGKRGVFYPAYYNDRPSMIRSGRATISGPDMTPVLTFRNGQQEIFLPGSSLKGSFAAIAKRSCAV